MTHKTDNILLAEFAIDKMGYDEDIYEILEEKLFIGFETSRYIVFDSLKKNFKGKILKILTQYMVVNKLKEMIVYYES